MWTINYLQDNMPSFGSTGRSANAQEDCLLDYSNSKFKLKIKKGLANAQEFEQKTNSSHLTIRKSAVSTRSIDKQGSLNQTTLEFQNGRFSRFNSLPELDVSNGLEFSFQENSNQQPVINNQGQNKYTTRQRLLSLIVPKLIELKECKNKLQDQCFNLKRQIINFQTFKTVFFEHFTKKVIMHVNGFAETERKEKNRLNQLVLYYIRDLEHSEAARAYFQEQNSKLQHSLIKQYQIIDKLRSQVKKLKTDVAQLQEENEECFNEASNLQTTILKLTQSATQGEQLREELNKTKEHVKQLESKMGNGVEEAKAFERDLVQYRKEIEAKIKQGWSQFKGVCDHLLPLGEKIREGFSQLDAPSRHRSQLAFLKSKAEQKIDALMAFQSSNYIQLSELERDDARYKLYSLLNLMSETKVSVFDQLKQSHGLLDYQKTCGESMTAVIRHCSTSLQNQPCCSRPPSHSGYTSRKVDERIYNRQMSEFFTKQSVATMRTSESQLYRILNNSCSESNIAISRIQNKTIKRTETMGKMSKIQERLNTLRREVRQNLDKIT